MIKNLTEICKDKDWGLDSKKKSYFLHNVSLYVTFLTFITLA